MRELFLLDPDLVFLNHGSFGACPRPVFDEYQRLQRELERSPVEFLSLKRGLPALIAAARERLAAFVGAAAADLILIPNATTGVNAVARALDLQPGDEVVSTTHEYGGNELLWRHVCESRGARLVEVDTLPATAVDDLLGAFTPRTRALFVSHISSPTALCFPAEELCAQARAAGVLTIVDGAHAPGQVDLDVSAIGADFYAGNCHKWLCAPKGAGFLHVRPEVQALLEPSIVSWDWPADAWADRFRWTGTRDPSAHLAVRAAIDFQAEHDWESVRERCHALAAQAGERSLRAARHRAVSGARRRVRADGLDPAPALRRGSPRKLQLAHEHRIEVLAQTWQGEPVLRVSFQGYNDEQDLEALSRTLSLPPSVRPTAVR